MKILCIGDVVSRIGRDMLFKYVDELKYKKEIDIVIANAENSNHGRGMTRNVYEEMMRAGVDGFTMGNHTWGSREIIPILKNEHNVVRPANYSRGCPGRFNAFDSKKRTAGRSCQYYRKNIYGSCRFTVLCCIA